MTHHQCSFTREEWEEHGLVTTFYWVCECGKKQLNGTKTIKYGRTR